MYENGINPGVHLLGLYFKISDEQSPCPISFLGGLSPPPRPRTTIPGMKSQTYLIEFSLWGKLYRLTDSPQSDPFLSVHWLLAIGFRLF